MNKSIISKLTFNDLDYNTRIPNGYTDNNIYSKLKWDSNNTPTVINSNNIKVMQIKTNTDRIHITQAFTNSASIIDSEWEVEANIKILTLNSYNGYFGWTNQHGKYLGIYIRNSFKGGLSLTSTGGKEVSFNYKFEANKEYNIIVSYIAYNFRLIINGEHIGVIDGKEFIKSLSSTNTLLMMFGSADGSSTDAMTNGLLWNMNVSLGGGVKNEDPSNLTKYGTNLLSRLNFDNLAILGTANISVAGLESVMNSAVSWNYDSTKINNYTVNTTFTTNINNNFTANIKFSNNRNRKDVDLITYGNYKVTYNYISIGEPEPIVVIDSYTKSALDFENGLVDKIPTTVWNKEGTASVTTTNKIFGDNSFETKALGDSLYTNSNIITGGSTPFTIEFYLLLTPENINVLYNIPIFCSTIDDQNYKAISRSIASGQVFTSGNTLNVSDDIIRSKSKFNLNEINKITMSYDGSAFRLFINDILEIIKGTLTGYFTKGNNPYYFLKELSGYTRNSFGIIDNINIFDGECKQVRNYDEYEDNLIVDLAFDGENNSTKIVDNGTLKSNWSVNGNAKISTDQKFDGFSSLYIPYSNNDRNVTSRSSIIFENGEDFTFSFEFIRLPSTVMFSTIFTTGVSNVPNSDSVWSINAFSSYYNNTSFSMLRDKVSFINEKNFNKIEDGLVSKTTIQDNVKYKVDIVRKGMTTFLYINNVLDSATDVFQKNIIDFSNLCIGTPIWSNGTAAGISCYLKNVRIYKGVAVVPNDPTGKIQLDFDNNVLDKYNNSTWTNNGVTFDQVNSVKGYSAYLTSSNMAYTSSNIFNFGKNNFTISFDAKKTANGTYPNWISTSTSSYYIDIYQRSSNESEGKNKIGFYDWDSGKGLNSDHQLLLNNYYNWNIYKKGASLFFKINDVLLDINPSQLANYSFNQNGKSVSINGYSSSQRTTGYIDNFKTYKEDLVNLNTTYITNNSSFSASIENDDLVLKYPTVINSPVPYYTVLLKDSPSVKNFICEVETLLKSSIQTRLCFRTADFSRFEDEKLGYHMYIADNILRFGVGSNSSNNSWTNEQTVNISSYIDNKYHVFKIISNNNNFKAYIDDNLILSIDDSTHNISSQIAFRGNGAYTLRPSYIKNIKISDLNNNELYSKNFKSKIDNVIDKPAVHLPLETNATNIGFTPLTINSVGNPTHTTIDGKKCIKFESGKYLTINSNNIFNLGANSDFYIEFDFYIIDESILNVFLSNHTTFTNNSSCILYANKKIEFQFNNGVLKINPTINTCEIGQFNNFKLYRMNNVIYMNLNGVETIINENYNINFSISNLFLGKSGWSSTDRLNGYMSNFKMFVGTSEIPETYNDKKVLDMDFKPTRKSYLFKDNNNKCVIHPVNITQRDYQDSQYCCSFNGTNQYLQLGKNELFNFGNDDFVINIKFKVNTLNKTQPLLANAITSVAGRIFICTTNTNQFQFGYGLPSGVSNMMLTGGNVVVNTIYNMTITRINNKFTLYVDGVVLGENTTTDAINLNGNNNTWIGNIMNADFLDGTIYSLKVLRNITDLTLLDEVSSKFEESFTLTNGTDSQTIINDIKADNHNIRFVNDESTTSLIVDGEFIEVPSVENTSNELKLFDNYNSDVNDVKLYNTAFVDEDIFLGSEPLDTQFGEIEYYEESMYELEIPEGDYTLSGFIEGYIDREFFIYNTFLNYEIFRGTEYYDINGMNKYSLDDYEINDLVSGEKYKVLTHEMIKGFISGTVNLKNCGVTSNNMEVFCYRSDNYRHIGTYSVDKDGKYVIPNLDVNSRYDIIFRDKTKKIKDQISNYRKPMKY